MDDDDDGLAVRVDPGENQFEQDGFPPDEHAVSPQPDQDQLELQDRYHEDDERLERIRSGQDRY